ncbi:MAG: Gfo/Idh/MocA family oxidoreductase [Candidatus Poribacteria bacterium]|jgi:predicted dehydrogenase|nr:Gfo/Idh/MocA family oxidoreductase [Candidatus Poribacteria bacterium]MDP6961830.1 Gfo/Idh/MocA family oxidoreductase [Dehalococcoidia bacterium]
MGNTYRVGVVGCGGMGRSHTKQWNNRSDTKVVAVTDINQEIANKLAEENDVPAVYTDYQQMFEIEDLDILSIPTWQGVRAEVTVAAANAGIKAILGEKPMCASMGEANAMIESCEENGVKLAIGHQGRFSPTSNEVRRLVADGAIGEPTMVYHSAKRRAGLLNTGTHAIDGWRYILSDPETLWVIGQTARTTDRWERRSACEDLCMGLVCFEGGTRGVYEGDLPEPKVSMPTVYGTKGQIRTDGTGVIAKGNIALQTINSNQWQEVEPSPVETNQYQEMIDWIEGRIETHRSSGYQARYTIEIMMAIYESLRTKNIVTMPVETADSPLEIMIADGTLPVLTKGRYDIRAPFPEENR